MNLFSMMPSRSDQTMNTIVSRTHSTPYQANCSTVAFTTCFSLRIISLRSYPETFGK